MINNPLMDSDFLQKLDRYPHRTVYAKIILLNFEEQPVKEIQGRITAGSVNVDGASVIRRTCSLTMITQEQEIDNIYWGLKNKFKLEVGLENFIDSKYPEIIWFKQGLFLITSLSESLNGTNHTINISGKDKGCLINGEIGGTIPSTTNFGKMDINEEDNDGNVITTTIDLPIKTIIQNAVITFGGESMHNIILNDIDTYGMELMAYKGENNLYLLYDEEAGLVTNMTFNGNQSYTKVIKQDDEYIDDGSTTLKNAVPNNYVDQAPKDNRTLLRGENGRIYSVIVITKDESVGYRKTELTYPGDLIANAGEALSSILDKIKNMFATFEYFYDIDGHFVFQEKKNYVNSTWNPVEVSEEEIYVNAAALTSPTIYSFEDNQMLTAISKQPTLTNLKNDFSIQGTRKSATGADILIHMRYAIANKPIYYVTMDGKGYFTNEDDINALKEKKKEEIANQFQQKVDTYIPAHLDQLPSNLQKPQKNAKDGSWGPGWWDIRDWYEYYYMLKGEYPNGSMKWYSTNDINGCIKINSIPGYEQRDDRYYCWLIIQYPNGNFSFGHGQGNPSDVGRTCTYYESRYGENGEVITEKFPEITQYFIPPYKGCTDSHTYLEFLEGDIKKQGNKVYFYNPKFPDNKAYDQIIQDKIEQEIEEWEKLGQYKKVDWREIIYQMALDYFKYNQDEDFLYKITKNNIIFDGTRSLYPTGKTGYEMFYTDLQGFWRQIYNPNAIGKDSDTGYVDLKTFGSFTESYSTTTGFHENVEKNPAVLNFWFDFMDTGGEMGQYSIEIIGHRPKAVNDSKTVAIYYKQVPQVLFITNRELEGLKKENLQDYYNLSGYSFIQIPTAYEKYFSISSRGKSAQDALDDLLYQHLYCTENITLTSLPIYYLQPNHRIFVRDKKTNINGEYLINKITIPLTYNGTSSINAQLAPTRLY